ncbi:MAG: hypothetical protein ACFWTY_20565 [Shouchella clausii]|jgi:hypothetical protein
MIAYLLIHFKEKRSNSRITVLERMYFRKRPFIFVVSAAITLRGLKLEKIL